MKKIFSILFALVLVVSFCLVTAVPAMAATTYYVDGTLGTDDVLHGTSTGTGAFKTIQFAINDTRVVATDTIIVAAGTYSTATNGETFPIIVNKSVTIVSSGTAATTIIDAGGGAGPVVSITSGGVTFDGFTTQNASGATVYGIDMVGVSGCTVKNSVVKTISGTTYAFGLHLINSNSNTISDITISNLSETGTAPFHGAFGVWVTLSDSNIFTNIAISNITAESDAQGVMLYSGADGNSFTRTTISALTTTGSGVYPVGVSVWSGAAPCNGNTFTDTSISGINSGASDWAAGIQVRGNTLANTGNTFTNTNISDITSTGLAYGVAVTTGSSVTFNGGSIQNINATTSARGFNIWKETSATSAASIKNMTISVTSVTGEGVRIGLGTDASLSSIHFCNIVGNTVYGINNKDTATTLDATKNWWGTATGPYHPTANPTGQGNSVSDNVNFTNWLTQAASSVEMTAQGQPATPPTVTTSAASNVAFTLATLNGDLTDMGTATSVDISFVYGVTSKGTPSGDKGGYDSETSPVSKGAIDTFIASPTGLTAGRTYYFRAKAQGNDVAGPVYGSEVSFTTAAITTLDATDIGAYTATLKGHLEIGSATSVALSFEYGTTIGYGTPAPATPSPMTLSGDFSADLSGLTVGGTYHFQALGNISGDIGYGGDKQFTTAPVIGISVSPTYIDFGDIIAGHSSAEKTVTVTNEGDYKEKFTTSLANESPTGFYTSNLAIDTKTVALWFAENVEPSLTANPGLVLSIPIGADVGPKTATLIFWAEAEEYY